MNTIVASSKAEILATLDKLIEQKIPTAKAGLIKAFANQYYGTVAVEDLESFSIMDLYGALISLWNFISERNKDELKIQIYNPHHDQHAWQSTHTIIEINCKDMPFLVDSTIMEVTRQGFHTHFSIHIGGVLFKRDENNKIIEVRPRSERSSQDGYEAIIHLEIDRQTDPQVQAELKEGIERVLHDVHAAVEDWHEMKARLRECLAELETCQLPLDREEVNEAKDFLRWLSMDHFTLLACRDYKVVGEGEEKALKIVKGTGLGVLRDESNSRASRTIADMPIEARKQLLSQQILIIAKTNTISTVHRPVYTDYIGVKRFDKDGNMIGERRFIGLYTSTAYNTSPKFIPFLRRKVTKAMLMSGLLPTGHAAKALLNILETLPRDDLFQASVDELYDLGMGIYHLQERRRIRLFVRKDIYGRFYSCLVYVPRDRFSTELRIAIQKVLMKHFNSTSISYTTQFTDSLLARIHFEVRVDSKAELQFDSKVIEHELVEVGRTWKDDLHAALCDHFGEEKGNMLFYRYQDAFPVGYRDIFTPRSAIYDIEHIEALSDSLTLNICVYILPDQNNNIIHFKLFQCDATVTLSDALPLFENMGLRVIGEQPHEITFKDGKKVWINDFAVVHTQQSIIVDIGEITDIFKDAFTAIWKGHAENDGFNRLVLSAKLTWREVAVLRAYAKYFRQIGFTFSQNYIEAALAENPQITEKLVELFKLFFAEKQNANNENKIKRLIEDIEKALDNVANMDEDRIIRRFLTIIQATYRTNFFQLTEKGEPKDYIAFKFNPNDIPDLPLPKPLYEIFIYSPRFEGVHLRMAKVARGGIRWSDRREDFRTEVLGLMKAQQVKNAVIVPQGAKGGFVPKMLPTDASREALMAEVIHCYQQFIRGLLDVTDNLIGGEIIKPQNVTCYDDDDHYLVVAADKGTATFSDIANQIAKEYGFWLGDAFASGGSAGYDHKKMGITARGAWESVKRHFREVGIDIQHNDFTVVGIGDMSGDVFGNGMLLSKHIKLQAAFNHLHIFVDPHPDPAISFNERQRLFNLPRSSWEDYNPELISAGGGVFKRSAKYIKVSDEIKSVFNIKSDFVTPNDLIRHILKAKVDLLWNGGIGTYVKATAETNLDVGDRANDAIRINGNELNCRIVGEGGNLGLTQLGRVEYSLNNGICFTDFIDNSAGVDCSDHEVNIKILLNDVVSNGDMTEKQRNQLLAEMQAEVATLVLENNYEQTLALSRAVAQATKSMDLYENYINDLEDQGLINRSLEFLPDDKGFIERRANNKSLTRPELAVLLAYSKNILKQKLLETDIPEDNNLLNMLQKAFPQVLAEKYPQQMQNHSLRREIIATQLANTILNEMGLNFVNHMHEETGAQHSAVIRAYIIARRIYKLRDLNNRIIALDNKVDAALQARMFLLNNRLIRRTTRWMLRNRRAHLDITEIVSYFTAGLTELKALIPSILGEQARQLFEKIKAEILEYDVPYDVAFDVAASTVLYSAMDILEGAKIKQFEIKEFATVYYALGEFLQLDWLRMQITALNVTSHWEALARSDYRDEIDSMQRKLTTGVLFHLSDKEMPEKHLQEWYESSKELVDHWQETIATLKSETINYTMLHVVMRQFLNLSRVNVEENR